MPRSRHREEAYDAIKTLRNNFHYHFISASGPIEEASHSVSFFLQCKCSFMDKEQTGSLPFSVLHSQLLSNRQVRDRVLKEFEYQSSLELSDGAYASLAAIPTAADVSLRYRQRLISQLERYQVDLFSLTHCLSSCMLRCHLFIVGVDAHSLCIGG
jgi:hypothetical protein